MSTETGSFGMPGVACASDDIVYKKTISKWELGNKIIIGMRESFGQS